MERGLRMLQVASSHLTTASEALARRGRWPAFGTNGGQDDRYREGDTESPGETSCGTPTDRESGMHSSHAACNQ